MSSAAAQATAAIAHYEGVTARSRELWERASRVFPQGVSGQAKFFSPYPVFVSSCEGATVRDVDGREYVDLLMGAGPMLLGHRHPHVTKAVGRQLELMTNPMMPTEQSIELAERLGSHMPYLERLRFTNTGSEATRSAVRVARAATGRTRIAKFEGNYHGSDDQFLVSTHSAGLGGTDERPEPRLDYAGLSPRMLEEVLVLPYNNGPAAAAAIAEHADELAAVIMEPVAFSSGGGVPADREFALAVRAATASNGIPLIFDEVLCALRLGLAGAPAYLGVRPDLATIGKAVGGGLPLAAFGGREDLMEATLGRRAGERKIFQSGTFTENPVSVAAGMAVLDVLETTPALATADEAGAALRRGLVRLFESTGVEATVTGKASIVQVHLGTRQVANRRDILRADTERTREFLLRMVAHGVLWPPVHPGLTSAAHGPRHVELVLEAARHTLEEMA